MTEANPGPDGDAYRILAVEIEAGSPRYQPNVW